MYLRKLKETYETKGNGGNSTHWNDSCHQFKPFVSSLLANLNAKFMQVWVAYWPICKPRQNVN